MPAVVSHNAPAASPRHFYLVDANGYVFRAYHSLPPLTNPQGTPVGAVYGFVTMLMKLRTEITAKGENAVIVIIFDASRQTFRSELFEQYKANREATPEDLVPQFPLVRQAAEALNLPIIEKQGYEADDIIATYAREAREKGEMVTILSSDKDLMQLISEGVAMIDPMRSKPIGEKEVIEKFGVGPDKVLEVLAFIGDTSDNIPGVHGVGPKTAAKLIEAYGSLDGVYQNLSAIVQKSLAEKLAKHESDARLSRELVKLCDNVPDVPSVTSFTLSALDPERLLGFLNTHGFRALISRVEKQFGVASVPAPCPPSLKATVKPIEKITSLNAFKAWLAVAQPIGKFAMLPECPDTDTVTALDLATSTSACQLVLTQDNVPQGLFDVAEGFSLKEALTVLKPVVESPGTLLVLHDAKPWLKILGEHGIKLAPVEDIMLQSYLLEGTTQPHTLEALAARYEMSAVGADLLLQLYNALKTRLVQNHLLSVYERIERPLIFVLSAMEQAGVKVDVGFLGQLSHEFGQRIAVLEKEICELAGCEFLIASPKQLGEVLFERMKLPGGRKTKSGVYSTDAGVLDELAVQGHPIAEKLLEWRQLSKLKSTYTEALRQKINPRTGRLHTTFAMAATSTGRLSSLEPNLQNIPIRTEVGKKIRKAFIAEPGYKLISADYSQIELRLLAQQADIQVLKVAFKEGKDIHAVTASQVFGVPLASVTSEMRRRAKSINFGIIYGQSAFGLAANLKIDRHEAAAIIKAYFQQYPGIEAYMDKTIEFARDHGYVTTLMGRKCYIPGIKDKNPARRNFAERAAINAPLQGTAADIIKRAMIELYAALEKECPASKLILQVHDELLIETPEHEVEKAASLVKHHMESVVKLDVPITADIHICNNWGEK